MANPARQWTVNALASTGSPIDAMSGYTVTGTLTLSNSYTQGGDAITAALFGFGQLIGVQCESASGYVFRWNGNSVDAGATIMAYYTGSAVNTVLLEATGTTNFNAVPFEVTVTGTDMRKVIHSKHSRAKAVKVEKHRLHGGGGRIHTVSRGGKGEKIRKVTGR